MTQPSWRPLAGALTCLIVAAGFLQLEMKENSS